MARVSSDTVKAHIANGPWSIMDAQAINVYAADGTTLADLFTALTGATKVTQPLTAQRGSLKSTDNATVFYMDPGTYVRKATLANGTVDSHSFVVTDPTAGSGGGGSSTPLLDWTDVTLSNSSTPLGDPFELAVRVRVLADGTVQMKGMIQAGANLADTQAVCTLPAAARPTKIRRLLLHSAAGPLATNINPSGAVTFPNGLTTGSWVSLDAVFAL